MASQTRNASINEGGKAVLRTFQGQPSMRRLPLSTENVTASVTFLLLRLHISCFCTRRGGSPGRAGSARRQGSLDGRFVRFREHRGERAGHTRLLHFVLNSWLLGFAFRSSEDPPRGLSTSGDAGRIGSAPVPSPFCLWFLGSS